MSQSHSARSNADDPRLDWGPGEWYEETQRLERERDRAVEGRENANAVSVRVEVENRVLRRELEKFAEWLERDRREPDKVLCVVQSMRRAAR